MSGPAYEAIRPPTADSRKKNPSAEKARGTPKFPFVGRLPGGNSGMPASKFPSTTNQEVQTLPRFGHDGIAEQSEEKEPAAEAVAKQQ